MSLLLWVLDYVHYFINLFRIKDYTIQKVTLEYIVKEDSGAPEDLNSFWSKQQSEWVNIPDIFTVNVDGADFLPLPACVQNPILKITYVFNSREYVYVTRDMEYSWPPKKSAMRFAIPYKHAVLVDSSDTPVKNITNEVNQYAGPRSDFHGAPVPLTDMIDRPFTKLILTNIMNQQSVVHLCG
jgi:hypothetical protein